MCIDSRAEISIFLRGVISSPSRDGKNSFTDDLLLLFFFPFFFLYLRIKFHSSFKFLGSEANKNSRSGKSEHICKFQVQGFWIFCISLLKLHRFRKSNDVFYICLLKISLVYAILYRMCFYYYDCNQKKFYSFYCTR